MPTSAVVWRAAWAANACFSGRGVYTRAGGGGIAGSAGGGGSGSAEPSASRNAEISCRVRLTSRHYQVSGLDARRTGVSVRRTFRTLVVDGREQGRVLARR